MYMQRVTRDYPVQIKTKQLRSKRKKPKDEQIRRVSPLPLPLAYMRDIVCRVLNGCSVGKEQSATIRENTDMTSRGRKE